MTKFNIEDYLNSLPDDIEEINVSFKNLTYLPSLKRFYNLKKLYCYKNELTSLPELNHSLQDLDCTYNQLTSLPELNPSLQRFICHNNELTSLPKLNNSLKILNCDSNKLKSLPELNPSLQRLICSNNELTSLPKLNNSLYSLDCRDNKLTSLPELNSSLEFLYSHNNLFPSMFHLFGYMPEDLKYCVNYRIKLNSFKELFWSLKYKQKFRDILWKKIRLPKIEKQYHPDNLIELLIDVGENEEELDHALSVW